MEDIFPKEQLNQEATNNFKKLFETEQEINMEGFMTGNTKKDV